MIHPGWASEGRVTMECGNVPGHVGLEEQFVPKGSIRIHIKRDRKGDLEMENGNSDLK